MAHRDAVLLKRDLVNPVKRPSDDRLCEAQHEKGDAPDAAHANASAAAPKRELKSSRRRISRVSSTIRMRGPGARGSSPGSPVEAIPRRDSAVRKNKCPPARAALCGARAQCARCSSRVPAICRLCAIFQGRDMLRATALAPILRNGITKEVENFAHQKKTPRLRPARFGRPTLLEFCPPPPHGLLVILASSISTRSTRQDARKCCSNSCSSLSRTNFVGAVSRSVPSCTPL